VFLLLTLPASEPGPPTWSTLLESVRASFLSDWVVIYLLSLTCRIDAHISLAWIRIFQHLFSALCLWQLIWRVSDGATLTFFRLGTSARYQMVSTSRIPTFPRHYQQCVRPFFARYAPSESVGDGMQKKDTKIPP
jgi:hypothetical protein